MAGTPAPGAVWVDGALVPASDATVSAFDHGLVAGDGVFETVLIHDGYPFALGRHLERLARSATGIGLVPPPEPRLRTACEAVTSASGLLHGRLRVTVTAGPGPLGSGRGAGAPTVVVAAAPLDPWPPAATVAVAPWPRNERGALAGLKTTSYAENVVALADAHQRGASEAVFANLAGNLCEGTGSNVFVAARGRLVTPSLASGCLAGVTRALLIEALRDAGAVVAEEDVPVSALARGEVPEAFLTSTTRGVQPVSTVDGRALAACPGPLTTDAAEAYARLLALGAIIETPTAASGGPRRRP
ncbi:MAG: aminotransferase class IV [Acidimicrobiales bacterium]